MRIEELLDDLNQATATVTHQLHLDTATTDEAHTTVMEGLYRRNECQPQFLPALLREGQLRAYLLRAMRNAAYSALAERRRHERLPAEEYLPSAPTSPLQDLMLADANRLIAKLRREVSCNGNFTLDVAISGLSLAEWARRTGLSYRTARRRFTKGRRVLAKAIERLARLNGRDENEFTEARRLLRRAIQPSSSASSKPQSLSNAQECPPMCTEQTQDLKRHIRRYKLRAGDLRYRERLGLLSREARTVVQLLEMNATGAEIKDALARACMRDNAPLTPAERRFGQVALTQVLREVRRVFGL